MTSILATQISLELQTYFVMETFNNFSQITEPLFIWTCYAILKFIKRLSEAFFLVVKNLNFVENIINETLK